MSARLALALLVLANCSGGSADDRIARYAGERLGVEPGELRVTSQTDLETPRHQFHLVSRDGLPLLVVVQPVAGELFDARTPEAFERVARGEDAVRRLGQLGAERVALWFSALGGGICPQPASSDAKFATLERDEDGVTIRYPIGGKPARVCVVVLDADGGLRQARAVVEPTPQAQARPWREGDL